MKEKVCQIINYDQCDFIKSSAVFINVVNTIQTNYHPTMYNMVIMFYYL